MKVLIVAKTRQGGGACIGGITFKGRSVRLIAADAAFNEHVGLEYAVGEVWEVDATPAEQVVPPHVENIIVRSKHRLGPMTDPVPFIEARMPPIVGGAGLLYAGLAQVAHSGALYIAERTGIPPCSTLFWRPDQSLQRTDESKRIRYRYPTPGGGCTLTFVGFQEPIETIPAGALVRVSLAHWWRPEDDHTGELRCYVQLSGWFLPRPAALGMGRGRARTRADASIDPPPVTPPAGQPADRSDPEPSHTAGLSAALGMGRGRARTSADAEFTFSGPQRGSAVMLPIGGNQPKIDAPAGRPADRLDHAPPPTPGLSAARGLLRSVFGYDDFRPLQAEIIANILARHDTLAVMPTGSGKSLCYQLPALLFDGLTVVVSPLIALMQDQVTQLHELGVPAAFLNSTLDYGDYLRTAGRARSGEIKLLYTSPETLVRPETRVLLDRARVACLAIDEAHCISQWGHDFRPEYRQLLPVRQRYPTAACVAFTATATERVQDDIKTILGFRAEDTFVASYNRENLFLAVARRHNGPAQVLAFLEAHRDQPGIIYCSTRRGVDELAARLQAQGWPALPYHAGLDDATRRRNQELFSRDKVSIMVATIAFGMGINKSNVRFVLHYNLPESLEHYCQEIGRAGRDGLRADCLLLFSQSDLVTRSVLIDEGAESERPGRQARLQAMVRYAEARDCRRTPLLAYFGETYAAGRCGFCDNCLAARSEVAQVDATLAARKFLACVLHTGQMFGVTHIVDILRGSRRQEILRWRHERVPEYAAGQEHPAAEWRRLAEEFIRQGVLEQDMGHGGLRLTAAGQAVLDGAPVFVPAAAPRIAALPEAEPAHDAALFDRLRALRRELADAADVPPYVIFSDRSLTEMATCFPQSPESLLAIHGVGQRKLAQYGEPFLAAIRAYCAEHGLAEQPKPAPAPVPEGATVPRGSRTEEVGALFAAGQSMADIQALFGVTQGTVIRHLARCVWAGQRFAPEHIREMSQLSEEDQARALAALTEHGTAALKPVFEALGGTIPYDELHVMRMYWLCAKGASEVD